MLDNQSGAVTALDSDGTPIPGVLDPNGTGVPLTGNESSLSLKFEEEQLVTNVKIKVSPNVEGAAIQYTDENGNVVSKKFNILPNQVVFRQAHFKCIILHFIRVYTVC